MHIEEAIRKFVALHSNYRLLESFTPKNMGNLQCLGVLLQETDSYINFCMELTQFFDENDVDDPECLLEGASVEETERGTVAFFPGMKL